LKNQTKNEDLRVSLEEIECLLKKPMNTFHHPRQLNHNAIEGSHGLHHDSEDEPEYYEDEPGAKILTVTLMKLKQSELPCPEEASDPTELPLSRESIGFDMSWVKVISPASSTLRVSLCSSLLIACLNILRFC
jgi:hypothetical protein